MILLIGASKGGVGKSTLATNLAVQLALAGARPALVDCDIQPTSAAWAARRQEAGHMPAIPCYSRLGDVSEALKALERDHRVIVVDAGGRDTRELRTALAVADLFLVPCRPAQADLETLPSVAALVQTARQLNNQLEARIVLTMASSNPLNRELADARSALEQFQGLAAAKNTLGDRKIYRDALLSGRGVVELNNSQARAEIQLLADEFFDLS